LKINKKTLEYWKGLAIPIRGYRVDSSGHKM